MTYQSQYPEHRINMPPLVRREAISGNSNLRRHHRLEFIIGHLEECQQLSDENPDVAFVDQGEAEIECPGSEESSWKKD